MQLPWVGRWTLLACLAAAGPAWAEDVPLRVVVVPKVTADGQTRDAGPLEAWVHDALRESGHRVVDLDASLRAQSYALSDAVANGQVPEELTVLNADAAWSVQLACERDAGNPQALGLTYYCTLTRKVVRISQGDTVYSAGVDWHDIFGSNFGQALFGGNVKKRAPALISEDLGTWTAQWTAAEGPWDVDLKLSGLGDRSQAEALAKRIGSLPGVTGARLLAFNTGVSQVAIRGEGSSALASLGDALEGDPALGLVVTHQVDRLLHARLDVARMHRRGARLQVVPPSDAAPKSLSLIHI